MSPPFQLGLPCPIPCCRAGRESLCSKQVGRAGGLAMASRGAARRGQRVLSSGCWGALQRWSGCPLASQVSLESAPCSGGAAALASSPFGPLRAHLALMFVSVCCSGARTGGLFCSCHPPQTAWDPRLELDFSLLSPFLRLLPRPPYLQPAASSVQSDRSTAAARTSASGPGLCLSISSLLGRRIDLVGVCWFLGFPFTAPSNPEPV